MKKQFILAFLILMSSMILMAQEEDSAMSIADPLVGEWTIDLRPTPDAEGYYQKFEVTAINGNTFTGVFYGSEIENGLINRNWDEMYFAFTTSDASSDYYHSGYLENGALEGITYCPNRAFTAPWTGVKE